MASGVQHDVRSLRVPRQRAPYESAAPRRTADRRRARRALMLPLVLGCALLLAAGAATASVVVAHQQKTRHAFVMTGTAGGLVRDRAQETALADRVAQARSGFEAQFSGRLAQFASAVYVNDGTVSTGPAGPVVLLGAAIDTHGDPRDFVQSFRSSAQEAGYRVTGVDAGPGARGVCAESRTAAPLTTCAWSTGDSIGEVVPTVTGWHTEDLARVMRGIRADVELTWQT